MFSSCSFYLPLSFVWGRFSWEVTGRPMERVLWLVRGVGPECCCWCWWWEGGCLSLSPLTFSPPGGKPARIWFSLSLLAWWAACQELARYLPCSASIKLTFTFCLAVLISGTGSVNSIPSSSVGFVQVDTPECIQVEIEIRKPCQTIYQIENCNSTKLHKVHPTELSTVQPKCKY